MANATIQTLDEVQKIVGPALAVFVLSLLPATLHRLGFLIDGATYVTAAALLYFNARSMRSTQPHSAGPSDVPSSTSSVLTKPTFWQAWQEGFAIFKHPLVWSVTVMMILIIVAITGIDVIYTAYVTETGHSSLNVGYLFAAISAGLVVSSWFSAKFAARRPLAVQLAGSVVGLGLFFMMTGVTKVLAVMVVANFFVGVFNAVHNVFSATMWQDVVPLEKQGRFFSLVDTFTSVAAVMALFVNGALGSWLGPRFVILLSGAVMSLAGLLGLPLISVADKRRRQEIRAGKATELRL